MFDKPKEITPPKVLEPIKKEDSLGAYDPEEESGEEMEALDITCD